MCALSQICVAQWRPSYQPSTSVLSTVTNDYFTAEFNYNKWQGYFLNTVVVPAGEECTVQLSPASLAGVSSSINLVPGPL